MRKTIVLMISIGMLGISILCMPNSISANQEKDFRHLQAPKQPSENEITQMENELYLFETTMGDIVIELNPKAAPKTCMNFRNLIEAGFYDGIIFHRVIQDFMIQSGGFTETNVRDTGYTFKDEINPEALGLPKEIIKNLKKEGYEFDYTLPSMKHLQGVISMANAGPNTNSTQFFIVSKEDGTVWLNGKHTVFGSVVEGWDVVLAIEKVETDFVDKPLTAVTITKAQIIVKEEAPDKPDETITITLQIGSIEAMISGKLTEINPPPFIRTNRTVVPIEFIAECFEAKVQYDIPTKEITFLFQDFVLGMQINNHTLLVNNKPIWLDVPPFLFEHHTIVPLRAISEAVGAEIQWEASTQSITIILKVQRSRTTKKTCCKKELKCALLS